MQGTFKGTDCKLENTRANLPRMRGRKETGSCAVVRRGDVVGDVHALGQSWRSSQTTFQLGGRLFQVGGGAAQAQRRRPRRGRGGVQIGTMPVVVRPYS
jgi:hypothetical protein